MRQIEAVPGNKDHIIEMEDYGPEADGPFVVCRDTNLLAKRIFDIFSPCHGLVRVDLGPTLIVGSLSNSSTAFVSNPVPNVKSQGRKTAYIKFTDATSAEKAIDMVDRQLIWDRPLEFSHTAPLDLEHGPGNGSTSWDHADQAKWGLGNNALVASMLKVYVHSPF